MSQIFFLLSVFTMLFMVFSRPNKIFLCHQIYLSPLWYLKSEMFRSDFSYREIIKNNNHVLFSYFCDFHFYTKNQIYKIYLKVGGSILYILWLITSQQWLQS